MKKLKQQEKEEQNNPVDLKLDFSTLIISSRTFFSTSIATLTLFLNHIFLCSTPVSLLAEPFPSFHPPVA
jgi:hypothetical protein